MTTELVEQKLEAGAGLASVMESPDLAARERAGRRSAMRRFGLKAAGVAAALAAAGSSKPAEAQSLTDNDIGNFALNLEYLEAEFYLRAVTGSGLSGSDVTGTGTQGTVTGGSRVPFRSTAIAQYAQVLAVDELTHVRFLKAVLGSAAVAEPAIDLTASFTTLAVAAGLIVQGQTFNPYSGDVAFLLGAYVLEDVCVTALAGAARYVQSKDNLEAAAGLLGVEGYQVGAIRSLLANIGAGDATNRISYLRANLSGVGDNGTLSQGIAYNFVNTDVNALAFRRTPRQVLNIAYGAVNASSGGFFPAGVNGTIRS